MSTITCDDVFEFVRVCALLVREGVTFKADARTCIITLTGGF